MGDDEEQMEAQPSTVGHCGSSHREEKNSATHSRSFFILSTVNLFKSATVSLHKFTRHRVKVCLNSYYKIRNYSYSLTFSLIQEPPVIIQHVVFVPSLANIHTTNFGFNDIVGIQCSCVCVSSLFHTTPVLCVLSSV